MGSRQRFEDWLIAGFERRKEKLEDKANSALMQALTFEAIGSTAGRNIWLEKAAGYEAGAAHCQKEIDKIVNREVK